MTVMPSPKRKPKKAAAESSLNLGDLPSLVGFRVRMAQLVIYDDFMRGAPVARLTPGQVAILLLVDQNAGVTQQELSHRIGIEKSTLVVRLHRLAERGLLRRVRSSDDRRRNTLELTPQGKRCLSTMMRYVHAHEARLLSDLSSDERQQLLRLLSKVVYAGQRTRAAAMRRRKA
jgi:DNA-binding MarR family transcriptional regulator